MIHLFFYNQRLFNKSILAEVYDVYRKFIGEKLILLWDNSRDCKISFIEERLRELEAGKRSDSNLTIKIRELKNLFRYKFNRGW
jgi:hypothetical protein